MTSAPSSDQTDNEPDGLSAQDYLEQLLTMANSGGWSSLRQEEAALVLGVSPEAVKATFPDVVDVFLAWAKVVDAEMLAETGVAPLDPEDSIRDRLFDLLMRRIDALAPHKAAVSDLWRQMARDPLTFAACGLALNRSMAKALEASGERSTGPLGLLKVKGLSALWLSVMRIWLDDDTPDMSKTMAGLDKALGRAEFIAGTFNRVPRRDSKAKDDLAGSA